MKTRKVGRVLSLLLAIAMAVGLMIPAAGVLAADTGYTEVSTLAQLQKVLKTAPTDGTPVKIRLEATIHVPLAKWVYNEKTFGTSNSGYLADFYGALKDNGEALTDAEAEALMKEYMKPDADGTEDRYLATYVINRSYTNDRGWPASLYPFERYLKTENYHTYDGVALRIKTGSNVTIDLNGNSILLYETDDKGAYNGSTNSWQSRNQNNLPAPDPTKTDKEDQYGCRSGNGGWASVITVMKNATFTLQDKQGGGKLSGGTGNIIEANDIKKVLQSHTYHVDPKGSGAGLFEGAKGKVTGTNGYAGSILEDYGIPDVGQTSATGTWVDYKDVKYANYSFKDSKTQNVKGGGVYVGEGATFNMEGGIITENTSWISNERSAIFSAGTGEYMYALGGGVYVGKNATFNMTGGTITKNNARSYTGVKVSGGAKYLAMAQGGGVYIDEGAVMNFTGGNVDDNSTAVYADTNKTGGETKSQGGGIFVNTNGTLNMIGDQTSLDFNDYPTVRDNTCGGYLYARTEEGEAAYLYLEGAGIMLKGSANLSRAVIAFNTFPNIASGSVSNDSTSLTMIKRNDSTREVYYIDQWGCYGTHEGTDHAAAQASGNYTKLYKEGDTYTGTTTDSAGNTVSVTKTVTFATDTFKTSDTWLYGADLGRMVRSNAYGYQNGAGIYLGRDVDANNEFTASMTIGDRVWCYDNWDQVTNIEQEWSKQNATATHDDVCLGTSPDGTRLQYIGLAEPATECKIGVNVIGPADKQIIARKANDNALHQEVWEDVNEGYDPTIVDCQFFYDNGENATGSSYIKNPPTRTVIYERPEDNGNYLNPHATEHVLGFGLLKDGYNITDETYRTYVALNYNEADVHKYAKYTESSTGVMTGTWMDTFVGNDMWLKANGKRYTVTLPRPDYSFYGVTLPNNPGANNSLPMFTNDDGTQEERADLYFRGYEFYAPYGHSEKYFDFLDAEKGDSTTANPLPGNSKHSFTVDELLTWNDNKIHISVPSYNAMWYTERELEQSRNDVSVPKAMILVDSTGEVYIRVASLVGGYIKNGYASGNDLQPTVHTAKDGTELYFDKPAFVASTINATPTLEGGYKSNNKMGKNGTYDANLTQKLTCNATNTKTVLNANDYIQGKIADNLWDKWIINGKYGTANQKTTDNYVGIMWTNIDTGVNINDVYRDYASLSFTDAAKTVFYVTPCIEVLRGSASGAHETYYYGESRAFSIEQLIRADVAAGGIAPAPTTQG